ncbi:Cation transporter family protein [Dictyocaulus viviparus]|uniref:Cation transporter family protein n=1 Tax=Dictyocaulus viviparus TaxID=29172 RepID=A0A0D8Y4L0_DICVI|nr:Cation transporter family protein [Dictyocaulus viviparus]
MSSKNSLKQSKESVTDEEYSDIDDLDEILAGDLDSPDFIIEASSSLDDNGNSMKTSNKEMINMVPSANPTTLEDIARIQIVERKPIEQPQSSNTEILEKLLSRGYDWRVRPPPKDGAIHNGPVVVSVNMLIRSISKIDNVNMEYSVQLTFRESWLDERLKFGVSSDDLPEFVILTAGHQIWMPDSFFQNEKQAYKHMIDKPNVLIRVHKDGTILYSVRISMVLSCPMHLQNTQIIVLSNGRTTMLYRSSLVCVHYKGHCYYLLQLYIPSCMLVIVSWVSFWIDRTAVPARVTLGVTTLLTMTTQSSGINAKLPPVAYIKAIDVWIGACLTFIFGALLEFAWVTYIANRSHLNNKKEKRNKPIVIKMTNDVWVPRVAIEQEIEKTKAIRNSPHLPGFICRWLTQTIDWHDEAKRADLISRLLFPLLFVSFNIAYWIHYAQYQSP